MPTEPLQGAALTVMQLERCKRTPARRHCDLERGEGAARDATETGGLSGDQIRDGLDQSGGCQRPVPLDRVRDGDVTDGHAAHQHGNSGLEQELHDEPP